MITIGPKLQIYGIIIAVALLLAGGGYWYVSSLQDRVEELSRQLSVEKSRSDGLERSIGMQEQMLADIRELTDELDARNRETDARLDRLRARINEALTISNNPTTPRDVAEQSANGLSREVFDQVRRSMRGVPANERPQARRR